MLEVVVGGEVEVDMVAARVLTERLRRVRRGWRRGRMSLVMRWRRGRQVEELELFALHVFCGRARGRLMTL